MTRELSPHGGGGSRGGAAAWLVPIALAMSVVTAAQRPAEGQAGGSSLSDLRITNVRDHVHLVAGGGGNVVVQAGPEGVLVVDSGSAAMADRVLGAVTSLSSSPIQYVVNTGLGMDRLGGNARLRSAGATLTGGNATQIAGVGVGAAVIAHENLLRRLSAAGEGGHPIPREGWPTDTFFIQRFDLHFNGEAIDLLHQPHALTDSDLIVHFRRSDVIAAGDVFRMDHFPVIDLDAGGSINGVLRALNQIIELTVPQILQEGGTLVVPGHGRIGDESEVVAYRDMLTIIRDRVADGIADGQSLAEMRAMRPTLDYDRRWSRPTGPASTDRFVETVYQSLSGAAAGRARR